jgi:hypothetical protein
MGWASRARGGYGKSIPEGFVLAVERCLMSRVMSPYLHSCGGDINIGD